MRGGPRRLHSPDPVFNLPAGGNTMDKKNIEGGLDSAKGKIKETAGVITGDRSLETEGKLDQVKGKVKDLAGDLREGIKDGLDSLDKK
jgi:uncharacterized protein YjbJ (UPF0337 family)